MWSYWDSWNRWTGRLQEKFSASLILQMKKCLIYLFEASVFTWKHAKRIFFHNSETNEDSTMKLCVDLAHDVSIKWVRLHGHGIISMVATPNLPRAVSLSNKIQKNQQKIKIFKKFFLHYFKWRQKLQKDVQNIIPSAILGELKFFPEPFSPPISPTSS